MCAYFSAHKMKPSPIAKIKFWEVEYQNYSTVLYRITNCKYSRIGCPWRGPFHEAAEHEKVCAHPHRSGAEVMEALQVIDLKCEEEKRLYNCVFDLLSYEKITFNGMMLHNYLHFMTLS